MRQLLSLLVLGVLALGACAEPSARGIDLIDVSGPLDRSALDFISDSIEEAARSRQELAVVQLNSRAVLDRAAYERLAELIESPPLPIAVWVGPAPAAP